MVTRMCGGRVASAPLFHQGVTGADGGTDLRHQQAAFGGQRDDFAQRPVQVFLDIVAQRLQRGDIKHFDPIVQFPDSALRTRRSMQVRNAASVLPEPVGAEMRVVVRPKFRPALLLGLGGRAELRLKPLRNEWVCPRQRNGNLPHGHSWDYTRYSLIVRPCLVVRVGSVLK